MNLLERIKAQALTQAPASAVPELPAQTIKSSSIDDDLFLLTDAPAQPEIHLGQQKYKLPNKELFLAVYESALRRPRFFNVQNFCEYKKWILGDACYVLNTFKSIDADKILEVYLKYIPPTQVGALGPLSQLLWDIDLCVPEEYQRDFEQIIIDEGDRRQKNFS